MGTGAAGALGIRSVAHPQRFPHQSRTQACSGIWFLHRTGPTLQKVTAREKTADLQNAATLVDGPPNVAPNVARLVGRPPKVIPTKHSPGPSCVQVVVGSGGLSWCGSGWSAVAVLCSPRCPKGLISAVLCRHQLCLRLLRPLPYLLRRRSRQGCANRKKPRPLGLRNPGRRQPTGTSRQLNLPPIAPRGMLLPACCPHLGFSNRRPYAWRKCWKA